MNKNKNITFRDKLNHDLEHGSDQFKTAYAKESLKLDIALQISNLRKETGLNQREFAKRVGLTQKTISNIETGKTAPTIDTLFDIFRKNGKLLEISVKDHEFVTP